jgi:hypothetical protein
MQTNMISTLLSVIGCNEISGKYYMIADSSYQCYHETHVRYILIVCVPGLIFWIAFLPIYVMH